MAEQTAHELVKAVLTGWDIVGIVGSLASILGVIVSCIAAFQASKSKEAAEKASERTREIGSTIFTFHNLAAFDSMLALYETVKQMNIEGDNPLKLYPHIRTSLIHFKALIPVNDNINLAKVQDFLFNITKCEEISESAKINTREIEIEKINRILTKHTLEIQSMMSEMRKQAGDRLI